MDIRDISMFAFLIILGAIVWIIVFFVNKKFQRKIESTNIKLPYKKKDYLLTIAEKNFYEVLSQVAQNHNALLFTKVRLEDLLWLPAHTENRFGLRNRIKSKHVDFLLCHKENVSPLIAIELDDSSHNREDRIERDNFIDEALGDAGLPILHVKVSNFYNPQELSNQIAELLK